MQKRLLKVLMTLLVLFVAGCTHHRVYFYKTMNNQQYEPNEKKVKVVLQKDRWFKRRGYVKFAKIGVSQDLAECYGSDCDRWTHKKNIYQYLAEKSARKGAHIVQLEQKAAIYKKKVVKGTMDCEKWGTKRVRVYDTTCRGGQPGSGTVRYCTTKTRYVNKRTCVKLKKLYGYKHILWAQGFLWRHKRGR